MFQPFDSRGQFHPVVRSVRGAPEAFFF
jgi:hypothetical protein